MMLDIFSSFDPAINTTFSILPLRVWLILIVNLIIFIPIWIIYNTPIIIHVRFIKIMNDQANRTRGLRMGGFNHLIITIFVFMIIANIMGLIPFVIRRSRHLIMTLSFGLPLWLALIISSLIYNVKFWLARLLPRGAPLWLNPFLVIIETLRISVRPLTLRFRLAANIRAGHIVLTLIGNYTWAAITSISISRLLLISVQAGYIIFEIAICLVQAYIFCLLITLYADDHSWNELKLVSAQLMACPHFCCNSL